MRGWLHTWLVKVTALFHHRRLDRDLDDEIAFHLAMKAEQAHDSGATGTDAAFAARRRLGNLTQVKESCREQWMFAWVESVWQDVRFVSRTLRRSPAFALVAILSLGIGIGANTAVFTVLNAMFLRSLPVRAPEELRVIGWSGGRDVAVHWLTGNNMEYQGRDFHSSFSYPILRAFQDNAAGFKAIMGFSPVNLNIIGRAGAAVEQGLMVSGNFFSGLGADPYTGRLLVPGDDTSGASPVAVISYRLWEKQYGLSRAAVGTTIQINGKPYTIVGVTAPAFFGVSSGEMRDVYIPMARCADVSQFNKLSDEDHWWVQVIARRDSSVAEARAEASLAVVLNQRVMAYTEGWTEKFSVPTPRVIDGHSGLTYTQQDTSEFLLTLLSIVGLVLLITCTNLANLLLARSSSRVREIAVRLSIGAGRTRLVRHLLTESLTIAVLGGVVGVAIAAAAKDALAALMLNENVNVDLSLDLRVLGFALALSVLTALLFGAFPAFRAARVDLAPFLKQAGSKGGGARQRTAKTLIAAQVGLSMVVLVGAGLFIRTLVNLYRVDVGFQPDHLLLFSIDPSRGGYKDARLVTFYERMEAGIARLPGVRGVALSENPLLSWSSSQYTITIPGYARPKNNPVAPYVNTVNSNFVATLGMRVLLGRDFTAADGRSSHVVALVNERMSKKYFAGRAVGRMFWFNDKRPVEIIGVVSDAKYDRIRADTPETVYVLYNQQSEPLFGMTFEVRTAVSPLAIVEAVRHVAAGIDPRIPIAEVRTQQAQMDQLLGRERTFAALAGFFGVISLLLASIGLYGLLAYAVNRRTNEIGVRVALGAGRGAVQWLVLRECVLLTALGIAAGVPVALAATKVIKSRLYGVESNDPGSVLIAVTAMTVVAMFAAWLPARRAARVDPIVALRYE